MQPLALEPATNAGVVEGVLERPPAVPMTAEAHPRELHAKADALGDGDVLG
jgi:hypothetical protein